jgi:heme exporter protein A
LNGLDLFVLRGERVAILGANGAGKTTLIRILALLARPDSGSVEYGGVDAGSQRQIRSRLGVCLHESLLYEDLTVVENLRFFGNLYGVRNLDDHCSQIMQRLDLLPSASTRTRNLSRGQRQRASLARALIHDPPVLLLDEPDTGQDLASLERITDELCSDSNRTIVFATHQAPLALALGSKVTTIERGRARDLGPAAMLTSDDLQAALRGLTGI